MENMVKEAALRYNWVSPQDYLAAERVAEEKHEYFDGEVFPKEKETPQHEHILVNVVKQLRLKTKGSNYKVRAFGLKAATPDFKAFLYPDIILVNGQPKLADEHLDILQNPAIVFEVVSENSLGTDYGKKWRYYRDFSTVQVYVLVHSFNKMLVDVYMKNADNSWLLMLLTKPTEQLELESVGISISLDDIYKDIIFEPYEEPVGIIE